ncbi:MAG: hypothetical protein ACM3WV_03335 [Bacillota bacterium]
MAFEGKRKKLADELDKNGGILRFAPTWVPRAFMIPGRRLKLHPSDLYALGAHRGGINERWFASTTPADNGPGTPEDEGLSYIVLEGEGADQRILFRDAIDLMGDEIIGKCQMEKYGKWMAFSKFFDNMGPIPHHVHLMDKHAAKVGRPGKPEAYYFPVQQNFVDDNFPYTFFGLEPGTTRKQVIDCLKRWNEGDNGILQLSRAYRLTPGTGWDVPPGILHAPGSLLTYEPQKASDVYLMFQSMVEGRPVDRRLLVKDVPENLRDDYEYIVSTLDWERNVDPEFMKNRFREPIPVRDTSETESEGYMEKWIVYGSKDFSAKELTVLPGRSVKITDSAAYGFIMTQGYGTINNLGIETPSIIRYGQLTSDEMFVTEKAAREGVIITNLSKYDNIVMLKHFGPENPDMRIFQ